MADRTYENDLIAKGYSVIAGTDEAGRGPLAGPLVVAAVILPNDYNNELINDSKKLTEKKREILFKEIKEHALAYSIQIISVEDIDKLNIYKASQKGMIDCVNTLSIKCDAVISDAMPLPNVNAYVLDLIKGDAKSISVAAASILAKVTRDHIMYELDKKYPMYDLKSNKGYGTKKHMDAIKQYGYCEIHRKTYEPIKSMINDKQLELNLENIE